MGKDEILKGSFLTYTYLSFLDRQMPAWVPVRICKGHSQANNSQPRRTSLAPLPPRGGSKKGTPVLPALTEKYGEAGMGSGVCKTQDLAPVLQPVKPYHLSDQFSHLSKQGKLTPVARMVLRIS